MKKINRITTAIVLGFTLFSYSCSQDETMDDIIDNTEINSPSDPDDDGTGNDNPVGGSDGDNLNNPPAEAND